MVLRFAVEDVFQRVADQIWDQLEVGDFFFAERARRGVPVRAMRCNDDNCMHVLNPSFMGFPICMSSRQTDGPCCPMYSLSFGGACSVSVPASVMGTSPSRVTGTKPYDVGIIAFGVSSPAYPARSVDVPMSTTRAETSSVHAENV
jgi:hypothetical protein